jgi:hypothetical protein
VASGGEVMYGCIPGWMNIMPSLLNGPIKQIRRDAFGIVSPLYKSLVAR